MNNVKCSECGFLAVWLRLQNRFDEASETLRQQGRQETIQNDDQVFQIKCFTQKHDLATESCVPVYVASAYNKRVLEVINKPRRCEGHVPWLQGFHPKEHREMQLSRETLEAERKHANRSLTVAVCSTALAALSVIVGAVIAYQSANIEARATLSGAEMQAAAQMKTTQMQIEAQKEMAAKAPPINVTIQMPDRGSGKR